MYREYVRLGKDTFLVQLFRMFDVYLNINWVSMDWRISNEVPLYEINGDPYKRGKN